MKKRYNVVLADPPWQYDAWAGQKSRTADAHYPVMTTAQICDMKKMIANITSPNCALFLWATPPKIQAAFHVITAWGFQYKTFGLVWEKITKAGKPAMGMGHYTRANAEPCLLAIRGRMPVADRGVSQIIRSRNLAHSQKPDEQYERIERLFPDAEKIELFARRRWPGWDAWGNELETVKTPPFEGSPLAREVPRA